MTDNKAVEQIARAAQPLFDWIKQYYPKIDISDDKQLSLYTSYHNLSQVLDKLKEDHNVQESVDWQVCSECGGNGFIEPDHLRNTTCPFEVCPVCKGSKITQRPNSQPTPKEEDVEKLAEDKLKSVYQDTHNALCDWKFEYWVKNIPFGRFLKLAMIEMYNAAKTTK
jgi:hypothetical protein